MSGGFRDWLDSRTSYRSGLAFFRNRQVPEGPKWGYSTATCLLWLLVIECVTGFLLMATYSPSATTAWASVHFIERESAGAFIRGVHYFAAQAMIILFAVHVIRVLLKAAFRAPHEVVWGTGLLMLPLVLIWAITGNPLSGSVTGMSQIEVEGNILGSTPIIGPILQRMLIGGNHVGHLTLTHLYFLHVALLPLIVLVLLSIHVWQIYRHGLAVTDPAADGSKACPYFPHQTIRNLIVLTMVLGSISYLAMRFGAPLHAPADPQITHMPRPEWYFLSLFELRGYFIGEWEVIATAVIPMAVLVFLLLLPLLDRMFPRRVSVVLRFGIVLVGCGSWAGLTLISMARDRDDKELLASTQHLEELSTRARELASHQGVPIEGPAQLLRNDPRTQGPLLFARHCASCHSHADADGNGIVAEESSAPNLRGFGSRDWIVGVLDPQRVGGEDYFGHTEFAEGDMVTTIVDLFDLETDEERTQLTKQMRQAAIALSAEAALPSQASEDTRDAQAIVAGRLLISEELGCADCHRFHDAGELGLAPDLTGYGSREWLVEFISNPEHERFYGDDRNDRMPVFIGAENPDAGLLTKREVELLADWLRREWYEPDESTASSSSRRGSSPHGDPQIAGAD